MKIELRSIEKSFLDLTALNDVNLELNSGQLVAVVGVNGAGKSTLLKTLATLLTPDRGEILFDGQMLTRNRIDLRRMLLYLDESPVLLGPIVDHICRVVHLYHKDLKGLKARIVQWLKEFDLIEASQTVGLSRGKKYKAAFVALAAVNPYLWLLDEPFAAGVDPPGISAMRRAINKAVGGGSTVIYSTQIVELAESFSDRVLVVDSGKILLDIPTDQLSAAQNDNTLSRLFENLCQKNFK